MFRCQKTTIRRPLVILVCLTATIVVFWPGLLSFTFVDSSARRSYVRQKVKSLLDQAKRNPDEPKYVRQLVDIARSHYRFGATIATVAIGDAGESTKFVVNDLADLLESSDPYVAREAARAFGKHKPQTS